MTFFNYYTFTIEEAEDFAAGWAHEEVPSIPDDVWEVLKYCYENCNVTKPRLHELV